MFIHEPSQRRHYHQPRPFIPAAVFTPLPRHAPRPRSPHGWSPPPRHTPRCRPSPRYPRPVISAGSCFRYSAAAPYAASFFQQIYPPRVADARSRSMLLNASIAGLSATTAPAARHALCPRPGVICYRAAPALRQQMTPATAQPAVTPPRCVLHAAIAASSSRHIYVFRSQHQPA